MNLCVTELGDIPVSGAVELYRSGALRSCSPVGKCVLDTAAGELIPQFTTDDLRRKTVQAVHFYENGNVRSLPLESATPVFTPAGIISAEMLTFYESGRVKRVFPLNGKLSGYWSQEDEESLAEPVTIDTPAGAVSAKLISLCFYESGALRSITLWPGSVVRITAPCGVVETRVGVSFSEDGRLLSLEPASPTQVETRAGTFTAYDPDAVGIHGDSNSLKFNAEGEVIALTTTLSRITATDHTGREFVFSPEYRESLCGDGDEEMVPMKVDLSDNGLTTCIGSDSERTFLDFSEYEICTAPFLPRLENIFGELRCSV